MKIVHIEKVLENSEHMALSFIFADFNTITWKLWADTEQYFFYNFQVQNIRMMLRYMKIFNFEWQSY
jgi:hypothetical protein